MTSLPIPQLSGLTRSMYPGIQELVNARKCPQCEATIDPDKEFRDGRAMNEYMMTGLCQACQDKIFEDGDE
ncbi:hypothetical protein [Methanolobus psychrotolerans]|uniref:hypothetical protein n=1 Tax=Methanolobus psychrotolerans TaxID=1874706 RepID=UPI000B91B4F6|nr:hypothetical protein [Methanolobus psychrotolerans]